MPQTSTPPRRIRRTASAPGSSRTPTPAAPPITLLPTRPGTAHSLASEPTSAPTPPGTTTLPRNSAYDSPVALERLTDLRLLVRHRKAKAAAVHGPLSSRVPGITHRRDPVVLRDGPRWLPNSESHAATDHCTEGASLDADKDGWRRPVAQSYTHSGGRSTTYETRLAAPLRPVCSPANRTTSS